MNGEPGVGERPGQDPSALTSYHVRRARRGDEESVAWVVKRFSPLLRAAADYRLGRVLRPLYDPDDIVQDVWLAALPRLPDLPPRDGRHTPVVLKYLSSTLLYRVNNLVRKHIRGKPRREEAQGGGDNEAVDPVDELPATTTDVIRRLARQERKGLVHQSLDKLEPRDREILILRGIEQHPYKEIAALVGADPAALAVRFQRALEKLRRELPGSVYEELADE